MQQIRTSAVFRSAAPHAQGTMAGDFVFVSGQVPRRPTGDWVLGDFEAEVRCAMDNLTAVLASGGCDLTRVCKISVFLADRALYESFNGIYQSYFDDDSFPARTTIICALTRPEIRVEVEAVAYVGGSRDSASR